MNKFKLTLSLFLIGFLGLAQETQLTLKEAIDYALQNKSDAVKARLEVENSKYQIQEVRANALPQINIVGDITNNPLLQKMAVPEEFGGGMMAFGKEWQSTATASLSQQLFNQAVFTGLKAAKTTREFYKINAQLTEEQVIEKVANSYYEVYKTKSQLKTLDKTIENTTRVRDVIANLYNTGLAKKIDLDRTTVSLNNIKSNRQQLVNALVLQENALKYLIGMDINTSISFPENTFEVSKTAFVDNYSDTSVRTEIQLLEKQGELLALNKKAIRAQGYPSLSLEANFGYLGVGDQFPWFSKPIDGTYWTGFSSVGLKLVVPVFNGGSVRAKTRQAQIDIEKLEADKKDTQLAMDLAMHNAETQINNSMITLNTQKENVNLAKEVLSDIENNYKNGLASLTDLLDAETSYADAQNSYTNALLDYKLAEIQLIKAQGELKKLIQE
ncbi:TolC family protein [Myroides indicus]|uniref:Outer membrane protein TolC n=1 Tax=Myroides indicus TaxID=1323422 RepID=A0A4R7F2Z7_9FLAO|nr:TolC family protein [Myroides indicus]TDS61531.1 outer membrane protein TolC [Myroides indicus]